MLNFTDLPIGQVKPENNFPTAISASLWQALILNPMPWPRLHLLLLAYTFVKQQFSIQFLRR